VLRKPGKFETRHLVSDKAETFLTAGQTLVDTQENLKYNPGMTAVTDRNLLSNLYWIDAIG
jgi:hypothetical protein